MRSYKRSLFPIFPRKAYAYTTTALPSRLLTAAQDASQYSGALLDQELRTATSISEFSTAPTEQEVQIGLQICQNLALRLAEPTRVHGSASRSSKGPTSNLLSMEDRAAQSSPKIPRVALSQAKQAKKISVAAYNIVKDPKVFITPGLLAMYVKTQNILGQPQSFPHVFDLYASKPIPESGTSPIIFKESSASNPSAAVPLPVAQDALNAATEVKDLALCLSIIETSVSAPAFRRAKFVRKALLPLTTLALSPLAAYTLAWQMCQDSDLVDPSVLTNFATVGLMAYIGFTATIGIVAITTANDQMDRITWIVGTPLRERWIREEERALTDRVAGAWGLEDREKRGNEEGEEWENLRDWAFRRGMYLDKPELMEGME